MKVYEMTKTGKVVCHKNAKKPKGCVWQLHDGFCFKGKHRGEDCKVEYCLLADGTHYIVLSKAFLSINDIRIKS